ncbi:histone-lysine N-methyltransferase EHMT2-like [Bacillus rossius redtenbacheri]|uniref:histone-lysine N-methyltransferase EHMT2-like n=1 Tax=Bacillus rossius redtenbacheri TaxID=93214 RepID=UPI002FDCB7AD
MNCKMAPIRISLLFFMVAQATAYSLDRNILLEYNVSKNWVSLRSYLIAALSYNNSVAAKEAEGISPYDIAPMYRIGWWGDFYLAEELAVPEGCADITDASGYAMLHGAAAGCEVDVAMQLLARGANINQLDADSNTPIMLAVRSGCYEMVKYLIRRGALLDITNNQGLTALHPALSNGNLPMVKLLLDAGANVGRNITPIEVAQRNNHVEVVAYLTQRLL